MNNQPSFSDRLLTSEVVTAYHIRKNKGKAAVACSFGKDSMAVLRLVLNVDPEIPVVWCDTKCEHKLTYDFARRMIDEWNLNIHIAKAGKGINFWTIAKKHGLPTFRGNGSKRVPACCKILKDDPAEKLYEELGTQCIFTGITAQESRQRALLIARYSNKAQKEGIDINDPSGEGNGCSYLLKSGIRKVQPIAHWTVADVWAYHDLCTIPHCGVYDLDPSARVGCLPCTAYISWTDRMPLQDFHTYRKIAKMNGTPILEDF